MQMREIASLTALAAAISLAERLLPGPLPWLKPGLANIITLVLAARGQYRAALLVTVLRSFVAALAWGGLFSPGHIFSLSGGLFALAVTITLCHWLRHQLSLVGVSVAAAVAHGLGQLAAGRLLFLSNEAIFAILPWVLLASTATGIIVALLARKVIQRGWLV
jgi:heptaprenyl diphosphate synthase